jgi:hypothetical protein
MWFDHHDTDWEINLFTFDEDGRRPEDLFDGFYRTAHREGRECAQFTIMPKDSNLCIVQIRIFPDGEITIESHPSVFIRILWNKKQITVTCAEWEETDEEIDI